MTGVPMVFPTSGGSIPDVIEMQSEAGAAGVIHVAARALATHALSIFGDHSDVMAARTTGFALLCSNSVQEASMRGRIPLLHFFDGFRTSHEVSKVRVPTRESLLELIDMDALQAHRQRALSPEHPVLRGSSQNPDVFFQAREAINPYYDGFADTVQQVMDEYARATGRSYQLYEYYGHLDAERVIVIMGSGAETACETVDGLQQQGEKVGVLKVRLFRPLDGRQLVQALPETVRAIAVLDRTKEAGADGEPLYKDVVTALAMERSGSMPRVIGGRYGLSSKEFTPGMVAERQYERFIQNQSLGHGEASSFLPDQPGYQGSVDKYLDQLQSLKSLEVEPRLQLSSPYESLLRVRWAAMLRGALDLDLAVTGGCHESADIIKALLAGASVVQLCSVLLQQGPQRLAELLAEVEQWLDEKEYDSVRQMQGSLSYRKAANPAAWERENYLSVLDSFTPPAGVRY